MSPKPTDTALDAFFAGRSIDEMTTEPTAIEDVPEPSIMVTDQDGITRPFKIRGFKNAPNLRRPLVHALAKRATDLLPTTIQTEEALLRYFVRFLAARKRLDLAVADIDNPLLDDFRDWLDARRTTAATAKRKPRAVNRRTAAKALSVGTKRTVMDQLLTTLRWLKLDPLYSEQVDPALDLVRGRDWTAPSRPNPTKTLTRPQLKALVRICRTEVAHITTRLDHAWAHFDDETTNTLGDAAEPDLIREVRRLDLLFDGDPPAARHLFRETDEFSRLTFPYLWGCDAKRYQQAIALLSPTGRLIMPFLLLFAIYFRYNPTVLTALKDDDLSEQEGVNGKRIAGAPFKNRAGCVQHASWPATEDLHNPKRMLRTLARWTAGIRSRAPAGAENTIFITRFAGGGVRTLKAPQALADALTRFLDDHEKAIGTRFNLKSIRPTVINLVYHLFDGDVVAAMHAGHHRRSSTTVDHYLSDGAIRRNNEALGEAMQRRQAWLASDGLIDPRADRGGGTGHAATPGWVCADPFGSPVPESWGPQGASARRRRTTPCTAYGMCDMCQLGSPRLDSSESYAMAVKLREAILRGRGTMADHVWLGRWAPVLDKLERKTLRSFTQAAMHAADLSIPDLPTVE